MSITSETCSGGSETKKVVTAVVHQDDDNAPENYVFSNDELSDDVFGSNSKEESQADTPLHTFAKLTSLTRIVPVNQEEAVFSNQYGQQDTFLVTKKIVDTQVDALNRHCLPIEPNYCADDEQEATRGTRFENFGNQFVHALPKQGIENIVEYARNNEVNDLEYGPNTDKKHSGNPSSNEKVYYAQARIKSVQNTRQNKVIDKTSEKRKEYHTREQNHEQDDSISKQTKLKIHKECDGTAEQWECSKSDQCAVTTPDTGYMVKALSNATLKHIEDKEAPPTICEQCNQIIAIVYEKVSDGVNIHDSQSKENVPHAQMKLYKSVKQQKKAIARAVSEPFILTSGEYQTELSKDHIKVIKEMKKAKRTSASRTQASSKYKIYNIEQMGSSESVILNVQTSSSVCKFLEENDKIQMKENNKTGQDNLSCKTMEETDATKCLITRTPSMVDTTMSTTSIRDPSIRSSHTINLTISGTTYYLYFLIYIYVHVR